MPTLTSKRVDVKIISTSERIANFYAGEVIADRMIGPTNVSFRTGDIVYLNKVTLRDIQLYRYYVAVGYDNTIYLAQVIDINKDQCLVLKYINSDYQDQTLSADKIKDLYVVFKMSRNT